MQHTGNVFEEAAERYLASLGYRIVARNFRGAGAEIDRIAFDGPTLCFVEVKARGSHAFGGPAASVGRSKQRHLCRAASAYLLRYRGQSIPECRFDVVLIIGKDPEAIEEIELVKNAFVAPY